MNVGQKLLGIIATVVGVLKKGNMKIISLLVVLTGLVGCSNIELKKIDTTVDSYLLGCLDMYGDVQSSGGAQYCTAKATAFKRELVEGIGRRE